jgi:ferredoxin
MKGFLNRQSSPCHKIPNRDLIIRQPAPYIPVATKVIIMADIANKYPDNTAGKFYVDNQCIDCDLCRETAPNNFTRNDDGGYSYVYKQPENPDEEAQCKEAMEGCPVEAIGEDGDQ